MATNKVTVLPKKSYAELSFPIQKLPKDASSLYEHDSLREHSLILLIATSVPQIKPMKKIILIYIETLKKSYYFILLHGTETMKG